MGFFGWDSSLWCIDLYQFFSLHTTTLFALKLPGWIPILFPSLYSKILQFFSFSSSGRPTAAFCVLTYALFVSSTNHLQATFLCSVSPLCLQFKPLLNIRFSTLSCRSLCFLFRVPDCFSLDLLFYSRLLLWILQWRDKSALVLRHFWILIIKTSVLPFLSYSHLLASLYLSLHTCWAFGTWTSLLSRLDFLRPFLPGAALVPALFYNSLVYSSCLCFQLSDSDSPSQNLRQLSASLLLGPAGPGMYSGLRMPLGRDPSFLRESHSF